MAIQRGSGMNVSIDDLHERIRIVRKIKSRNDRGDIITDAESVVCDVWAKVYPYNSKKTENTIEQMNPIIYRIVVRYREDIKPDDIVVWNNRRFEQIATPYDVESRRIWIAMECRELVPDG